MLKITVKVCGMTSRKSERHINRVIKQRFKVNRVSSSCEKGEIVIITDAQILPQEIKSVIISAGYQVDTVAIGNYKEGRLGERLFDKYIKPRRLSSKIVFRTPTKCKSKLSGKTVNLYGYEVLVPPFKLDFDNWTKEQAEEYRDWFIENMHERAEYVMEMCRASSLFSRFSRRLPLSSPDNLLIVWKWFRRVARTESVSEEEIEAQRAQFDYLGESFISKTQRTVLTECIISDIGMLMSVILTENYSDLYWDIIRSPKNHVYLNRPVIKGFIDNNPRYPKPFEAVFEPVHMVGVQAAGYINHISSDRDLLNVYRLWIKWIPETCADKDISARTE